MPEGFAGFYENHAVWLLPVLIFFARVLDVSIGTMRIVFLSRGMRLMAPVFGFFEVLIWLIAISRIMGNLTSWVNYVAYASGFAAGNYVGMYLENRLAMGLLSGCSRSAASALPRWPGRGPRAKSALSMSSSSAGILRWYPGCLPNTVPMRLWWLMTSVAPREGCSRRRPYGRTSGAGCLEASARTNDLPAGCGSGGTYWHETNCIAHNAAP